MSSSGFRSLRFCPGVHREEGPPGTAWRLATWAGETTALTLPAFPRFGVHLGFVAKGPAVLTTRSGVFPLPTGFFFAAPADCAVHGGAGFVVSVDGPQAMFQIGGPIEQTGRMRYIDGCTDSLLVPPGKRGDPCLNFLAVPPHTIQTPHTHPSVRIGYVVSGSGRCVLEHGTVAMEPGTVWVLDEDILHHFCTDDATLRLIVFHPDSDFGPSDDDHPMLNRTIVDGRSAARLTPSPVAAGGQ